jgi:hemoglobin
MHFAHWLLLFNETVDENFIGTNANIAKERASNIARIFEFKLSTLQPH